MAPRLDGGICAFDVPLLILGSMPVAHGTLRSASGSGSLAGRGIIGSGPKGHWSGASVKLRCLSFRIKFQPAPIRWSYSGASLSRGIALAIAVSFAQLAHWHHGNPKPAL